MATIKTGKLLIESGQNAFDLAIQVYGNIEKVYEMIKDNSFFENIDNDNISGNTLNFTTDVNFINEHYRINRKKISTSIIF